LKNVNCQFNRYFIRFSDKINETYSAALSLQREKQILGGAFFCPMQ
jgi:hypothetical protein